MVMFMYALQRRLSASPLLSKISVLALDPGGMAGTKMGSGGHLLIFIMTGTVGVIIQEALNVFMANATMGPTRKSSADIMFAVFDEKILEDRHGAVYLNGSVKDSSVESRDEEKQERAWEGSLSLAGIREEDTALKVFVN